VNEESVRAAHRVEHLRLLGRYDEAETVARDALAADPSDGLLLYGLAAVLHQQGRYDEALHAADAALADLPDAPVYRQRALALSALDRPGEAMAASATAVSLDPHGAASYIVYAAVLQQARSLPAAYDAARWAIALAPEEPTGHLILAEISNDLGDRKTARAAYHEVLRLDPENVAARHDLAVLDLSQGKVGTALRGLLDAGALAPAELSPSGPGAKAGLPVLTNVTVVLWRLAWYLRLVLFIGFFVVVAASPPGPPRFESSTPVRVAAAVVLLAAGLLSWRFVRTLPPRARSVLLGVVRSDALLISAAVFTAVGFALYGAIVVTGYPPLALVVFALVVVLFALTLAGNLSRRRERRRRKLSPAR
jgi:tetratricopeptide (TPR) repeat protein